MKAGIRERASRAPLKLGGHPSAPRTSFPPARDKGMRAGESTHVGGRERQAGVPGCPAFVCGTPAGVFKLPWSVGSWPSLEGPLVLAGTFTQFPKWNQAPGLLSRGKTQAAIGRARAALLPLRDPDEHRCTLGARLAALHCHHLDAAGETAPPTRPLSLRASLLRGLGPGWELSLPPGRSLLGGKGREVGGQGGCRHAVRQANAALQCDGRSPLPTADAPRGPAPGKQSGVQGARLTDAAPLTCR